MKLSELHDIMRRFNGEVAPGGECAAWGDFVEECRMSVGIFPWEDDAADIDVDDYFADYWVEVSEGTNLDYTKYGDNHE